MAGLILGNEVLTGKVVDQNGPLLLRSLREKGVPLRCLLTLPDDVETIVAGVQWARAHARYVVTSGGIGPTHDDVTVRAIAQALDRRVVRLPQMATLLEERGAQLTPEVLRLADAPEGSEILPTPGSWLPTLLCEDVFLLAGVPPIFAAQLQAVLPRLPAQPVVLHNLYLGCDEVEVARLLEEVAKKVPEIAIGSYPQWDRALDHRVRVTIEGTSEALVQQVVEELVRGLPRRALVRRD